MPATAKPVPNQSQSGSPMYVTGIQVLEPSVAVSLGTPQQEADPEAEEPGLQPHGIMACA